MSEKAALMQDHVLAARHLGVRRAGHAILADVALGLRAREFTVLLGPNGAGKTTLLRALAGLIDADGDIELQGRALGAWSARARARQIAYLPQGHQFHWPLKVADIIALGRTPFADTFGWRGETDRAAIIEAARTTGTSEFLDRSILSLSGGERARVSLARAFATNAPIMLADEPTAALDARHQLIIMDLLRQSARRGAAVLAVVHDLSLASRFADRLIVMDRGRIVADGTPENVLTAARLAETFGIEAQILPSPHGPIVVPRAPLP